MGSSWNVVWTAATLSTTRPSATYPRGHKNQIAGGIGTNCYETTAYCIIKVVPISAPEIAQIKGSGHPARDAEEPAGAVQSVRGGGGDWRGHGAGLRDIPEIRPVFGTRC